MEVVSAFLDSLVNALTHWSSRIAVVYLCLTIIIAYVIWINRGKEQGFIRFLLPREVYFHRSNLVDFKIFLFNTLLRVGGFLTIVTVTPLVAASVLQNLGQLTQADPATTEPTLWLMALVTLVIIFTNDFCTYWVHRVHHEAKVLWPFHSVHHSAEVMTPLTVFRKHPVYDLISKAFKSVLVGVAQGIMLFAFVGEISVLLIGSAHAGYVLFNAFGANLRHSHIWLSFGPTLEHVFISPAQHQIHHSLERKHYNKNYGEVFAIWDWMFGTLYVPKSYEHLQYGLSDENGERIAQPHPTLRAALIVPFVDCWHTLWKGTSRDPALKQNRVQQETAQ
jgi:sterol desaturase/sphingolipid hydroxylase (fatty acid hydroxylase superfamily)